MQKRKKDRKSMSFFQYITKKIRLNKKVETKEKKGPMMAEQEEITEYLNKYDFQLLEMLALKDLNNPYALDKIVVELSRKKETVLCHTMYLATIRKKQF